MSEVSMMGESVLNERISTHTQHTDRRRRNISTHGGTAWYRATWYFVDCCLERHSRSGGLDYLSSVSLGGSLGRWFCGGWWVGRSLSGGGCEGKGG